MPGTVTMIARNGRVVHFESHGAMDADQGTAMRDDAIFRIASMTKPITSVALMMLWEEGRFQLRDPVAKYLPEFANQTVSTTMDVSFCQANVEESIANYGTPDIMNTDQGSQFTSQACTSLLKAKDIRISMNGKRGLAV